jgi:hypothetical protein
MKKRKPIMIVLLGFLVGAIGYWTVDFSESEAFSGVIYTVLGPGAFLGSVISGLVAKKQPAFNALNISLGVMLGMLSRIFADLIMDPTSHNLFPVELMLGLVIVVPAAFIGSFLVYGIYYIAGKN